jgi:ATP-dependent DNA helicase RecG
MLSDSAAPHREDRLPVPAEALREIVLNAVIHRDVSHPSSYVAIAVFDDRIEVRRIGDFPTGVRAEQLSREHLSVRRNPLIAEAFRRTGAIEACRAHGIPDPLFVDEAGAVTVTLLAEVVAGTRDLVPVGHPAGIKSALSRDQVEVLELAAVSRALAELMVPSGRTGRTGRTARTKFRDQIIAPLLDAGLLAMTVPDKPRSPKQRYQATAGGLAALQAARRS